MPAADETRDGLQVIAADLHLHTCLSPCGTLDMTPRKIVARAHELGLAMIAVTDHNSAENVGAVRRAAAGSALVVLPGLEVTTAEEGHLLALFEAEEDARALQAIVYEHLAPGENDENLFGLQVVANERDEVEAMNPRLLLGATNLTVEELVAAIHDRSGLAIAAHIDRETFGLVAQLGFLPEDLPLDAVEISWRLSLPEARQRFPEYRARPFLGSSDAHDLEEIGRNPSYLRAAAPSFGELRRALRGEAGRAILEARSCPREAGAAGPGGPGTMR